MLKSICKCRSSEIAVDKYQISHSCNLTKFIYMHNLVYMGYKKFRETKQSRDTKLNQLLFLLHSLSASYTSSEGKSNAELVTSLENDSRIQPTKKTKQMKQLWICQTLNLNTILLIFGFYLCWSFKFQDGNDYRDLISQYNIKRRPHEKHTESNK